MWMYVNVKKDSSYIIAAFMAITAVFATATIKAGEMVNWQVVVLENSAIKQLNTTADFERLALRKVCISKRKNAGTIMLESNYNPLNNKLEPVYTTSWSASLDAVLKSQCGSAVVPEYAINLAGTQKNQFHAIALKEGSVHMSFNEQTMEQSYSEYEDQAKTYESYNPYK